MKMKWIIFILLTIMAGCYNVSASDDGFIEVQSEAELKRCLENENACRLTSNLNITTFQSIDHDVILDLNGYIITPNENLQLKAGLFYIKRGGKLTIQDTKGGKISTGTSGNVWAAIQMIDEQEGNEIAELIVNGGTIEGYYYGITGNGTRHNSKITINDGTIKGLNIEDSAGIYQPQIGDVIINGGTITGGTGIEIRSGNLTINNGTIMGLAPKFVKVANKNGTTTNGVGVAIAEHITKNNINVAIYDGKINGQYALYEWNPHSLSKEDLNKINLHIYGGNFETIGKDGKAVYSEDFTNFISGGKFNTDVTAYLTADAKVSVNQAEELNPLNIKSETKRDKMWFLLTGLLISLLAFFGWAIYQKKITLPF